MFSARELRQLSKNNYLIIVDASAASFPIHLNFRDSVMHLHPIQKHGLNRCEVTMNLNKPNRPTAIETVRVGQILCPHFLRKSSDVSERILGMSRSSGKLIWRFQNSRRILLARIVACRRFAIKEQLPSIR